LVTVSNSANRDQTMSTRGNQSTPVQWSPLESTGVHWTQSRVESTGLRVGWSPLDLPSGLESTGVQLESTGLESSRIGSTNI
jgi:hypothetical protein